MAELSGFTLFQTGKGWQCSTREKGVDGWSVQIIDDEAAQHLLAEVTSLHKTFVPFSQRAAESKPRAASLSADRKIPAVSPEPVRRRVRLDD